MIDDNILTIDFQLPTRFAPVRVGEMHFRLHFQDGGRGAFPAFALDELSKAAVQMNIILRVFLHF